MSKANNITYYHINKQLEIKCWWEKTSYGFRHLAQLVEVKSRKPILQAKASYHNRTWEEYDYQSVIHALIDSSDIRNKRATKKKIDDKALGKVKDNFKTISTIASLGDIFTDNQKDANGWKARMLKAGLGEGLSMPEDWDTLTEDEKQKRLDGAIKSLQ